MNQVDAYINFINPESCQNNLGSDIPLIIWNVKIWVCKHIAYRHVDHKESDQQFTFANIYPPVLLNEMWYYKVLQSKKEPNSNHVIEMLVVNSSWEATINRILANNLYLIN